MPMLTAAAARAIVPKASLRDSSLFINGRFTVVGDSGFIRFHLAVSLGVKTGTWIGPQLRKHASPLRLPLYIGRDELPLTSAT
jgi:hypothetical protein